MPIVASTDTGSVESEWDGGGCFSLFRLAFIDSGLGEGVVRIAEDFAPSGWLVFNFWRGILF